VFFLLLQEKKARERLLDNPMKLADFKKELEDKRKKKEEKKAMKAEKKAAKKAKKANKVRYRTKHCSHRLENVFCFSTLSLSFSRTHSELSFFSYSDVER
jgi:hypothetical protein